MLDRDPRRLAAWAAAALILVVLSAWYLTRSRPAANAAPPVAAAIAVKDPGTAGGGQVTVDVAGAVKRPGVYRLSPSQRVEDALKRAGGPASRADLSQINRAAKLEDGRQILVPLRPSKSSSATAVPAAGTAPAAPSQPLNLNTATLEQLDTLDGVGPATAQKILDYRTEHGGFSSIDELDQIPGIGEKRLAAFRESLQL
jgi:competence protein ComEA